MKHTFFDDRRPLMKRSDGVLCVRDRIERENRLEQDRDIRNAMSMTASGFLKETETDERSCGRWSRSTSD